MTNISIDKALLKASPKKRALVLSNHMADLNAGGKGLLTHSEFESLISSFKTDQEIRVYRRFKHLNESVQSYLTIMPQFRFRYMVAMERLDKLIIMHKNNLATEDGLNLMLSLIKDEAEKKKALNIAISLSDITIFKTVKESKKHKGLVEMDHEFLEERIKEAQKEASDSQILLKACILAIQDYLKETGLSVKIFQAHVKEVEIFAKGYSQKGYLMAYEGVKKEGTHAGVSLINNSKYILEKNYEDVVIEDETYRSFKDFLDKGEPSNG